MRLFFCLSVRLSVCLSVCMYVCMSVYLEKPLLLHALQHRWRRPNNFDTRWDDKENFTAEKILPMSTEVSKTILRQYQHNVSNVRHYNVCRVFRYADHIMLSVVAPVICTEPRFKSAFTSVPTDTWDSFQDLMRKMFHPRKNLEDSCTQKYSI